MERTLKYLYWLNAVLLSTHEVDAAYWKEWDLFHLPGALTGFLLLHVALFALAFWGYEQVVRGRRAGWWMSLTLAVMGIFGLAIHGILLLKGYPQFKIPVSIIVLIIAGAVSIVQAVVAIYVIRKSYESVRHA